MPCESCAVQFSVFKRKRSCCECERYYCSSCLRRGGGSMCAPCRVLSTRPLSRQAIANFKVRDLQCFLQRQNVSTRGCVEKEELVSLCVSHVNSASFRRRGSRAGSSAFSSLRGITSNINEFISAHFDPRQAPQPEQRAWPAPPTHLPTSNCYNTTHTHSSPANNVPSADAHQAHQERFTITPGGEADIRVQMSESHASVSRSASTESALVDTADCYKVEDLDDSDWELVNKPADPLPNEASAMRRERAQQRAARGPEQAQAPRAPPAAAPLSPQRAASELELRQHDSAADTDSASMSDEPLGAHSDGTPRRMSLGQFNSASQLDLLNVKQLKELLMRNRVEYRGCLERADLLHRAKTLWRNHAESSHDSDNLPLEECCKICMAAPLECVLLECGHIAACTQCSKQLSECPFCRQYVVRAVRFFRS